MRGISDEMYVLAEKAPDTVNRTGRYSFCSPSKVWLGLEADFGGFGVGSDFSWQVVGTYGFDTTCLGTPLHALIGYRALSVDFSENGKFGKNGIDMVQHGPIMGVTFRW